MGKKIIKLNERQLNKIVKRVLNESYTGIIKRGDDICEIICKRKLAQYGSTGNVVKMIQHLLDANGFNTEYEGGGMEAGCSKEYPVCDGLFKRHTRDAVKEFQRRYKLTVDGIVGYNTWKAMCDNLEFTLSLPKEDFCKECQCNKQRDGSGREIPTPNPIDDRGPIGRDPIDRVDCKKLKACLRKFINSEKAGTRPDIEGYLECIGDLLEEVSPIKDIPKPKEDTDICRECKKVFPNKIVNLMPMMVRNEKEKREHMEYVEFANRCLTECDGYKDVR